MNSTTTTAAANGGTTESPIADLHPDIIQSHILNRLDGPTLASAACASPQLLSLCSDDRLWTEICNSTFPSTADASVRAAISSFPSGHRSFYSDSFPTVRSNLNHDLRSSKHKSDNNRPICATSELISAVDIYCGENLLTSRVLLTETQSSWFAHSPFRLDLLTEAVAATPLKLEYKDNACVDLAK